MSADRTGVVGASVPPLPARTGTRPRRGRALEVAAALAALTKPRIVELLLVTTVPTMLLAAQGAPAFGLVAATLVGGAMSAAGANALNMVIDRDIDAKMSRTRGRPLVTGALSARAATLFALGLEVGAAALVSTQVNVLAAGLTLGAAAFYVLVYSMWLKRSTSQNIVIGGAAGAVPVLVGWAAVHDTVTWPAWALFAVVVLWTPPHFWALAIRYREDYAGAGVPMLPVVVAARTVTTRILGYAILTVAASLTLAAATGLGWPYGVGATALGAVLVRKAWMLRRRPTTAAAMALFHYSILYLALLFGLVAICAVTTP